MRVRASRVTRPTFLAAVLLLLAACFGDTRPRISIMWGVADELEGAAVEIDGKVVGKLEKFGQNPQTAFPVDKGDHTLRIVSDRFDCEPFRFDAQVAGMKQVVILNFAETSTTGKPTIVFQR